MLIDFLRYLPANGQYISTPTQINDLLSDDLSLTTAFLKQHPKVYWIWNHRQWCLQQVPDGPSEADDLLTKDGRAWRPLRPQ